MTNFSFISKKLLYVTKITDLVAQKIIINYTIKSETNQQIFLNVPKVSLFFLFIL